jgi:hypothetical protein
MNIYGRFYCYFTDASHLDRVDVSNEIILGEYTMTEIENEYAYIRNVLLEKHMLLENHEIKSLATYIPVNEDNDA